MLRDDERRLFEEIVAGLEPVAAGELRCYLVPWWFPPAVLALYAPILLAAAVLLASPVVAVVALAVAAASCRWAVVRRARNAGSPPLDLSRTPPFIA